MIIIVLIPLVFTARLYHKPFYKEGMGKRIIFALISLPKKVIFQVI